MKDPEKPVVIPDRPDERKFPDAPEFVRNIMGSSAGAGSGEFHVYRHLRRKEYARQRFIKEQARRDELDEKFQKRVEEKKRAAEDKTAKKRAKRLKRKQKSKQKRAAGTKSDQSVDDDDSEEDEEDEKEEQEKEEKKEEKETSSEKQEALEQSSSNVRPPSPASPTQVVTCSQALPITCNQAQSTVGDKE